MRLLKDHHTALAGRSCAGGGAAEPRKAAVKEFRNYTRDTGRLPGAAGGECTTRLTRFEGSSLQDSPWPGDRHRAGPSDERRREANEYLQLFFFFFFFWGGGDPHRRRQIGVSARSTALGSGAGNPAVASMKRENRGAGASSPQLESNTFASLEGDVQRSCGTGRLLRSALVMPILPRIKSRAADTTTEGASSREHIKMSRPSASAKSGTQVRVSSYRR